MEIMLQFNRILNSALNGVITSEDEKILSNIKTFMLHNPDNLLVKDAKKTLANILYIIYTNKDLTDALNIGNDKYFRRIIEVRKNDPACKYPWLLSFFSQTIFIPEPSYIESNIIWFLQSEGFNDLDNIERILAFYYENTCLINSDKYDSIAKETERYLKLANDELPDDYEKFAKDRISSYADMNRYYEGSMKRDYLNKKLGNIGELYTYENLPAMFYNYDIKDSIFVSRDCGDGYGYDIYASNNVQELLIEVKSTTYKTKESFILTSTELANMRLAVSLKNVSYIVPLVCVDFANHQVTTRFFEAIEGDAFKEIGSGDVFAIDHVNDKGTVFRKREKIN